MCSLSTGAMSHDKTSALKRLDTLVDMAVQEVFKNFNEQGYL